LKGTEHVIYAFKYTNTGYPSYGQYPNGNLVSVNGILYGTTRYGGTDGYGTVFSITPQGTESVLHSFTGGADGGTPYLGVTVEHIGLYGSTTAGDNFAGDCYLEGYGTIFNITSAGNKIVLYSFRHSSDGDAPSMSLIEDNYTLYGSTEGGTYGRDTAFSLSIFN
jgi:uncharacterized repeat protein (TIGR03803 family)